MVRKSNVVGVRALDLTVSECRRDQEERSKISCDCCTEMQLHLEINSECLQCSRFKNVVALSTWIVFV